MSKSLLTVLASEEKKSQKGNIFQVLQCLITYGDGRKEVGKLNVYGDLGANKVPDGDYFCELDLRIGFGDDKGEVKPVVVGLVPAGRGSDKLTAAAAKA